MKRRALPQIRMTHRKISLHVVVVGSYGIVSRAQQLFTSLIAGNMERFVVAHAAWPMTQRSMLAKAAEGLIASIRLLSSNTEVRQSCTYFGVK